MLPRAVTRLKAGCHLDLAEGWWELAARGVGSKRGRQEVASRIELNLRVRHATTHSSDACFREATLRSPPSSLSRHRPPWRRRARGGLGAAAPAPSLARGGGLRAPPPAAAPLLPRWWMQLAAHARAPAEELYLMARGLAAAPPRLLAPHIPLAAQAPVLHATTHSSGACFREATLRSEVPPQNSLSPRSAAAMRRRRQGPCASLDRAGAVARVNARTAALLP